MRITPGLLLCALAPPKAGEDGLGPKGAALWAPWIEKACNRFGIITPRRVAAFLAQAGHESAYFTRLEEGLNYSAEGLIRTWPTRFTQNAVADPTKAAASDYHRQPQKIANRVYANRMGNGDEASGDGWKFRGGGLFQLTGRADYAACGQALGMNLVDYPEQIRAPGLAAALSAGWEWGRTGFNDEADAENIDSISRQLNGGKIGLEERREIYHRALQALC